MKAKALNLALIITSWAGYLEWGTDQRMFLVEMEAEIIGKLFSDPGSVMHPFVLLPLAGQLLLIFTLFQKEPGRWPTYLGMAGIGILLVMVFIAGVLGLNLPVALSTLPFMVTAILTVNYHRQINNNEPVET